ncbi:protein of unknown function [Candidatus Nitrotoga arctica]|uniref:Uncharacterized protein n=1 Tax=Candidatus Nitrotoga arctica TaxID=453162 RepID=A0ABM8YZ47_9PROT|nr:protein of unknown function [Candidatus Nitrotoga arctica]
MGKFYQKNIGYVPAFASLKIQNSTKCKTLKKFAMLHISDMQAIDLIS